MFSITLHFALCTLHSPIYAVATKDGLRTAYNRQENKFLMVWSDGRNSSDGIDCYKTPGCNPDVYAAFMDNNQNVSASFPIANTPAPEHFPEIAYNSRKNEYLVVLQSLDNDYNIYALRLNNLGHVLNTVTIDDEQYDQWEPSVAYDNVNDRYLVIFMGYFPEGSGKEVKAQILSAEGAKIGSLKTISLENNSSVAAGKQERPVAAFVPEEEKYIVVWEDEGRGGGSGTVLDKDGNIVINPKNFFYTESPARVFYPQISYNSFVRRALVVWQENGDAKKIKTRWLTAGGQKLGSEIILDDNAAPGAEQFLNPRPGTACDNANETCLVGWFNWTAYSAKLQFVNQNGKVGSLIDGVSSRPSLTFNFQQRYFLAVSTNNPLQFKKVAALATQPSPTPPAGGSPTPTSTPPHPSPTSVPPHPSPTPTPSPSSAHLDLETDFEGVNPGLSPQPSFLVKIIAKGTNFLKQIILKDKVIYRDLPLRGPTSGEVGPLPGSFDFVFSAFPFLNRKKSFIVKEGHNPESPTLLFGPMKTGDLNADNQINGLDWSLMKTNFGQNGEE